MRFSIATAALALGAVVSAAPADPAAPAKFNIQITAKLEGQEVTRFLGKGGNGAAVEKKEEAETCSVENGQLLCGGTPFGATLTGVLDMAPLAPTKPGPNAMIDGFSVGADNSLHWKSEKFPKLTSYANVQKDQNGEAAWGLFKSGRLTGGNIRLYSQLGCPGGTHGGFHDELVVGTGKVVPA